MRSSSGNAKFIVSLPSIPFPSGRRTARLIRQHVLVEEGHAGRRHLLQFGHDALAVGTQDKVGRRRRDLFVLRAELRILGHPFHGAAQFSHGGIGGIGRHEDQAGQARDDLVQHLQRFPLVAAGGCIGAVGFAIDLQEGRYIGQVGAAFGAVVASELEERNRETLVDHVGFGEGVVAGQGIADQLDVALEHRHVGLARPPVAGDRPEFDAQQVEGQAQAQGRPVRSVAERGGAERLHLDDVGRFADPRGGVAPDVEQVGLLHAGDELEVVELSPQVGMLQELVHRVPGEEPDVELVLVGDIGELVHADQAAGASNVSHDDTAGAFQEARQMLCKDARLQVGGAARREIDDHVDLAAGKLLRIGMTHGSAEHCQEAGDAAQSFHQTHFSNLLVVDME
jgi:hypothetical protein